MDRGINLLTRGLTRGLCGSVQLIRGGKLDDLEGHTINPQGPCISSQGQFIDPQGHSIELRSQVIDPQGQLIYLGDHLFDSAACR